MDGVGLQTESHQYGFDAQYLLECGDNGNAATATYCQRLFAESFGEAFLRSLVCRERDGAYISLPAVHGGDFYLYGIGGDSHDVIGKQLRNLVMILMRNQSAGYFGVCLGGQYGFGTFARIAAPDAAYIERRTATVALQRAVSFFAEKGVYADSLFVFLLVERDVRYHFTFRLRHFFHIVVEAGNGDASVGIRHLAYHSAKHIDGVGHRTAEMSGVQVAVRTGHLYLPVGKSAQAGSQRGKVCTQHAGVGHEDYVGFQQFFVFPAEAFEAGRANLFLSFEDELDVMSQQVILYQIFKSLYLDEGLSFVIVRTARPDVAVAYFGLEGIAFPEFQRFGGHYVVVCVYQYGFGFRVYNLLSEYDGIASRRHYQCFVCTGGEQQLRPAFGTRQHVVVVFGFGTDAGDTDKTEQFFQHSGFVLCDIFLYFHNNNVK